jgi:LmbE family N-acetylglucosaminyl deacetylase
MNKILVVAVHPDDETIGCGGTLLKLKNSGSEIHWLIATDVDESIGYDRAFVQSRSVEIEKVGKAYGFSGIHRLKLPSARVETVTVGEIVRRMSDVIKTVDPDTLFLPFRGDVHSDHRIVFDAAFSCTKSFRFPSIRRLYMMETLSETEFAPAIPGHTFVPNSFVDISEMFEKKLEIMSLYRSELAEHPFPRSVTNIKALATYRGATSGYGFAESFMLLKEYW